MKQLYIIKDKTDANFRKPFVSIHKSQESADRKVSQLRNKLNVRSHNLIQSEIVNVSDFDPNKNSVYVIFDKTGTNKSTLINMFFDYKNANEVINNLRKKLPSHAQKLIFTSMETIDS